ncbi:hypothetical protein A3741_16205 [Oleiphilus sp. HI0069]|nr:hypothetical protein A3741_16205 [Oleiphilus sp. HI0069]
MHLDLRPDFQRGEVWSSAKKKLLIDSILRGWQVPPIHTVKVSGNNSEVLDGQQRLTAIRDFIENKFAIDGSIEPYDDDIYRLNKKKYKELSSEDKAKLDHYKLKIFEITEYNQGEPGELFHRLNQSVKLTSAEQRNAFFGTIRDQVSGLVGKMKSFEIDKEVLGFSNSRMAYNDLLTRVCYLLENESLRTVINDRSLTDRYRKEEGFPDNVLNAVDVALEFLASVREKQTQQSQSLNLTKASSLNWIYFISDEFLSAPNFDGDRYLEAFWNLELAKTFIKNNQELPSEVSEFFGFEKNVIRELILLYIERSSSRVMSTGSILIRDLVINLAVACHSKASISLSERDQKALKALVNRFKGSNVDVKLELETASENWREEDHASS